MRIRGRFPNKQTWFSICSMHSVYDEKCATCNKGQWTNNIKHIISSLIFDYFPELWKWYINRGIRRKWKKVKFPMVMRVYVKTIGSELASVSPAPPDPNVVITKVDGDTVHTYPDGSKFIYSSKPHVYKEGDYGHDFLYGYYIINEKLEHVYNSDANHDEYVRLWEKHMKNTDAKDISKI